MNNIDGFDSADFRLCDISNVSSLEFYHYSQQPEIYTYLEYDPFDSIETSNDYLIKLQSDSLKPPGSLSRMAWAIRDTFSNDLVGTATLGSINSLRESVEIGYALSPKVWGRGYILPLQNILLTHAFDTCGANKVFGKTFATNGRVIQSALAAGFKHIGIDPEFYKKGDTFIDAWLYSFLKKDWDALKKPEFEVSTKDNIELDSILAVVRSTLSMPMLEASTSFHDLPEWDSLMQMELMSMLSQEFNYTDITRLACCKNICDIECCLNKR